MEQRLGVLAYQVLRAIPAAHGDEAEREEGHSHCHPMTGPPSLEDSTGHVHDNQRAEHYTGGEHASATGVAHAGQAGYAFSTEVPNFIPPVSTALELEDGPREMVHLPHLLANPVDSPELLEAAVDAGMQLIYRLVGCLEQHATIPDASSFLKSLKGLQTHSTPPRTVVGVVGNTGAGKSSIINALLDEEELLPTNCIRACTASPAEISYNHSEDPAALYRAEVEFITREEWIRELGFLFVELLDGNGEVSRECTNADSDAGVAYAKLKAVYPSKTKEMLASGNPQNFADEPAVQAVLGAVRCLQEKSALDLYRVLQQYVDSKEKPTITARSSAMEIWPLVKVVRIYTKAAALSTGAVIVDLPGVQDSNAARAAVAVNYMRACSGLWIVAPITRAVDDKTAKTLLGDSFKRQLKYDGTYSAVTFICSKTDDLVVKEAARNLGMDEAISDSCNRAEYLKRSEEFLNIKLAELRRTKAIYAEALDECEANNDMWEDMESLFREGRAVYAPSGPGMKRKRVDEPAGSRKNRVPLDSNDDANIPAANDGGSAYENLPLFEDRVPLTKDVISHTLLLLKSQRKDIRGLQRQLEEQMAEIGHEVVKIQSEREGLLAEVKAACIKGRNDYSREAIKLDFAMGIRELDQENAVEDDDAAFDPDQDLRDYDQVARSLPVFCVSSRAFQKLRGRLGQGDFDGHGYMTAEDTEIPQLQEHAKKLTEASRISNCRRFLNELVQLLNSMNFWAFNSGIMYTLPESNKRQEENHLRQLLLTLRKSFHEATTDTATSIRLCLTESIYNNFSQAIPMAVDGAVSTCTCWGAPMSMGGLCWSTYKATVRRNGAYRGSAGDRDFNAELFEPISRYLATGWERAFQRRLPAILSEFATVSEGHLEAFYQAALQRSRERFANGAKSFLLTSKISTHKHTLKDLPDRIISTITELQREASRESVPVILKAMTDAYEVCTAERGSGSFVRMKAAMVQHVETTRNTMFHQATATVRERLEAMCDTVMAELNKATRTIMISLFNDYMVELIGASAKRQSGVSPRELQLRASVRDVLRDADTVFALLPRGDSSIDGTSEEEPAEPVRSPVSETLRNDLANARQPFDNSAEAWREGTRWA